MDQAPAFLTLYCVMGSSASRYSVDPHTFSTNCDGCSCANAAHVTLSLIQSGGDTERGCGVVVLFAPFLPSLQSEEKIFLSFLANGFHLLVAPLQFFSVVFDLSSQRLLGSCDECKNNNKHHRSHYTVKNHQMVLQIHLLWCEFFKKRVE